MQKSESVMCLLDGYANHAFVTRHWRATLGYKANVNYTEKLVEYEDTQAVNYLLKYVTKDNGKYYWVGQFYKIKFPVLDVPICNFDGCNMSGQQIVYEFNYEDKLEAEIVFPMSKGILSTFVKYYGQWTDIYDDFSMQMCKNSWIFYYSQYK